MRLAWFTPLRPVRSGIATYTGMIVPLLSGAHEIDVFVDLDVWAAGGPDAATAERGADGYRSIAWAGAHIRSAHDFVPRHARRPYDLIVYQLGNARCHDYQWPYLLRYPGLLVLHDAQLHHARAAALLQHRRVDDYRAELAFCHPEAPDGVAEWVESGFGGNSAAGLYPLTSLAVTTARGVAVHYPRVADTLREAHPEAWVTIVRHGAPELSDPAPTPAGRNRDTVVFAAFGLVTPDKRVPQVLAGLAAIRESAPGARLRLVGEPAGHYDVRTEVARRGLADVVEITGFVDDEAFDREIRHADVCLCLRWPTNREASGPWYRCLAAGKPTVINDLVHLVEVPSLDPRTWEVLDARTAADAVGKPLAIDRAVAVSLDILDEDHSLGLAMRRLALDGNLRASLGVAARQYWLDGHTLGHMHADYERAIAAAGARPLTASPRPLPPHVRADGTASLRRLAGELGVAVDLLE